MLALLAACGGKPAQEPVTRAVYVGSEACRSCHAETWSTFAHTGMGRSWCPASTAHAIEDWTTHNTFDVRSSGLRYTMSRRDGKLFMRQSAIDTKGAEFAVDERELTRIVGSGNHSQRAQAFGQQFA